LGEQVIRSVQQMLPISPDCPHRPANNSRKRTAQRAAATDVVAFAAEIRPKQILPIHHSTYAFYLEPISELVVKTRGKPYRLVLVAEGTTTLYD
jgi:L-ascorbate metabolism protein UlaG (beta-lactamase superfamily)